MLVLLKWIKSKCPFFWNIIQRLNSCLVYLLYGKNIEDGVRRFLPYTDCSQYTYRLIETSDLANLVGMMIEQPAGFDAFFKPHGFDEKGFRSVFRDRAFFMFGVFDEDKIAGYFFIRFFMNKKAFRGKMVDFRYQGQGIAKQMGRITADVAFNSGFRLYATISKLNVRSMASSKAVNKMRIIKELNDDNYYIEYLPK